MAEDGLTPIEKIELIILKLRGRNVILDADLARLYGVSTAAFNQAMRRNQERFPSDFAFHLTEEEKREVITKCDHLEKLKYSKVMPIAFTEHGAIMAAGILKSSEAVRTSVFVVRAFVKMRETLVAGVQLGAKHTELERRIDGHDEDIEVVVETIRRLIDKPEPSPRQIGFRRNNRDD